LPICRASTAEPMRVFEADRRSRPHMMASREPPCASERANVSACPSGSKATRPRTAMTEQRRTGTTGTVWPIGHWTCPLPVVLDTLVSADSETLIDVRKPAASRRRPPAAAAAMPSWLAAAGIGYLHLPELGGRRPKQKNVDPSLNAGWRNASFKNYADYTLTPEFEAGLERLSGMAADRHVVVMCGEPMPWRCHRLLIANTLA